MRPAGFAALVGLLAVAMLALADLTLGRELGLSLFYAVPVFLVARHAGLAAGIGMALAAAAAWAAADAFGGPTYGRGWVLYWNAATRLGFFGMAVAVARMRSGLENEVRSCGGRWRSATCWTSRSPTWTRCCARTGAAS